MTTIGWAQAGGARVRLCDAPKCDQPAIRAGIFKDEAGRVRSFPVYYVCLDHVGSLRHAKDDWKVMK